ncbi:integrase family protein : Integrase family protein OS=Rhodopirellula sp. SWK7 GN=RRSWK_03018 PE=4 SV=1: Phage_integrase [Gemmata massiliana]|uniref:Tyr recombinase domain-containing protein n=1 Tax=Gemmata massiliana TaxID=1210884 RepID=A0A6P2D1D0_9BACT|nr:tyrosine-type recombinase/integrase [Gemmata massiliana]VTR95071.1 integrase family protein : Integrase family protein OS=Rhodopirellula sp. SWK7 GN=RRSWK_03018 PE=4 SV=1: Phage_integrase [Gemmata massiliana]
MERGSEEYKKVADDLHAGRTPRVKTDGLTIAHLCNSFLTAKLRKKEAGELTSRLFWEYQEVTGLSVGTFGGTRLVEDLADDFADLRARTAEKWGPVRLGNAITRTKSVFKYGYETGLMERSTRFGPEFKKPDKSVLRRHRAGRPSQMFEPGELRAMIDGKAVVGRGDEVFVRADPNLRAMILLGVNCGFGNMDCAGLTLSALDPERAWIDFLRPKTGIARRCPLWPETVAALREALSGRPEPANEQDTQRVLLTVRGSAFVIHTDTGFRKDVIGIQFGKLLKALGIHRSGVGFYALRHTFETIGGSAKDQVAVDLIMGHTDPSMAAVYREPVDDAHLLAVADHVRNWLRTDRASA